MVEERHAQTDHQLALVPADRGNHTTDSAVDSCWDGDSSSEEPSEDSRDWVDSVEQQSPCKLLNALPPSRHQGRARNCQRDDEGGCLLWVWSPGRKGQSR